MWDHFSAWLNGLQSLSHNADTVFSFLGDTFGDFTFLCLKNCSDRATQLPTSASFQPHFLSGGRVGGEQKTHPKKQTASSTAREVRGGPMLWHAHSWGCHDGDPQQLFAQTLPPGVLTGAIHHSGMGPPTIQGWAINRPELSRSSPVWRFVCRLPAGCLIGGLTTLFPCNLARQYTIIT